MCFPVLGEGKLKDHCSWNYTLFLCLSSQLLARRPFFASQVRIFPEFCKLLNSVNIASFQRKWAQATLTQLSKDFESIIAFICHYFDWKLCPFHYLGGDFFVAPIPSNSSLVNMNLLRFLPASLNLRPDSKQILVNFKDALKSRHYIIPWYSDSSWKELVTPTSQQVQGDLWMLCSRTHQKCFSLVTQQRLKTITVHPTQLYWWPSASSYWHYHTCVIRQSILTQDFPFFLNSPG